MADLERSLPSVPLAQCNPEEKLELQKLLVYACWHGQEEVVSKLAQKGIDFKICNEKYDDPDIKVLDGFTPLMLACQQGQQKIFQFLLEQKAVNINCPSTPNNRTVFVEALEQGMERFVRLLLAQGGRLNVNAHDKNKWTSLHVACSKGYTELALEISSLSGCQINFNAKTKEGWTPFMYAVLEGHLALVKEILKKDPSVCKTVNKKNLNAVMIAIQNDRLDCLKEIQSAVSPEVLSQAYRQRSKTNWNVVHYACAREDVEILKWILEQQKEIVESENMMVSATTKGYTPLLTACEYKHAAVVKMILERDDVDAKTATKLGLTGLHLAAMHDGEEIATELLRHGCDPKAKEEKKGNTALHIACEKLSVSVEKVLRNHSIDLGDIENKDGKIPEDLRQEVFIPREIIRRGNREVYLRALRKGSAKNSRCNLVVLGQERVGKTSLIKSIIGEDFDPNCKPTQGVQIDSIGTELTEHVSIQVEDEEEPWAKTDTEQHASDQISRTIAMELMGERTLEQEEIGPHSVEKLPVENLLKRIDEIVQAVATRVQEQRSEASAHDLQPPLTFEQRVSEILEQLGLPTPSFEPRITRSRTRAAARRRAARATNPHNPLPIPRNPVTTPPNLEALAAAPIRIPARRVQPQLSYHDSRKTVKLLKKKDPQKIAPTFHTIDFAGQRHYRPMHHCFITHRALYIVAFKLPEVVKYISQQSHSSGEGPLEEIQYWLNNIYAHASSFVRGEKPDPPKILLVGTHKCPSFASPGEKDVTDDDLESLHEKLKERIMLGGDDRFLESIQFAYDRKCFFALENSMTPKSKEKRRESGIIPIQKKLKDTVGKLSFFKMDIPISWIKFEKKLMEMRNERKSRPLSTTRDEVWQWAKECEMDAEQFKAAMQYFHDIRIIIDQVLIDDQTHEKNDQAEQRDKQGVVLLNPQWLSDIMSRVVDLKIGTPDFDQVKLKLLEKKGIVAASLLKQCWNELLSENVCDHTFGSDHPLFIVLKLYGLLYPLSEKLRDVLLPSPKKPEDPEMMFLFPFMLPEKSKIAFPRSSCGKFVVDFLSYLPNEVYSHLVIRFLGILNDQKKEMLEKHVDLSKSACKFMYVTAGSTCADWMLEIDRLSHTLTVFFKPREENVSHYLEYMVVFHEYFLLPVCESSNLGCLRYKGGPSLSCEHCKHQVILPCIKLSPGEEAETSSELFMECPECEYGEYDINRHLGQVQQSRGQQQSQGQQPPPEVPSGTNVSAPVVNLMQGCQVNLNQSNMPPARVDPGKAISAAGTETLAITGAPSEKCLLATGEDTGVGKVDAVSTLGPGEALDEDDLLTVVKELDTVTDVEDLGLSLGIRKSAIQKIKEEKPTLEKQKIEVVYYWLTRKDIIRRKKDVVPSWGELADAVSKLNELSQKIREKYCRH